jgi:hypothetical protein
MKQPQLSPLAKEALFTLKINGRVRTKENVERLAMIELKGFGLAEDPQDDVWQLVRSN